MKEIYCLSMPKKNSLKSALSEVFSPFFGEVIWMMSYPLSHQRMNGRKLSATFMIILIFYNATGLL